MDLKAQGAGIGRLLCVLAMAGTPILHALIFWRAGTNKETQYLIVILARRVIGVSIIKYCVPLFYYSKSDYAAQRHAAALLLSSCDGLTGASILVAYARWFDGLADLGRRVTITMRIFLIRRHTVLPFVLNDQLKSEYA